MPILAGLDKFFYFLANWEVYLSPVALWLLGIIMNLLLVGHYFDIALRDAGLFLGALALGCLSQKYAD